MIRKDLDIITDMGAARDSAFKQLAIMINAMPEGSAKDEAMSVKKKLKEVSLSNNVDDSQELVKNLKKLKKRAENGDYNTVS